MDCDQSRGEEGRVENRRENIVRRRNHREVRGDVRGKVRRAERQE